ncbi:MAG TPA: hypothetical protein VK745_20115 [Polyangiaceae bacterium]|jgi:hypothetical protein|nr:hypothetical protein [Polyangiaceae bacterium]
MVPSKVVLVALFGSLVSIGCIGSQKPAAEPSSSTATSSDEPAKLEGAADLTDTTPGSGNTGNGSPGPEGGPGSLGAGIGSGSGTGTGAGPGNSGSTTGSVSH